MRTITAISIHHEGDSPIFGKSVTTVRLEDEAGGAFIVLDQNHEDGGAKVFIEDMDELLQVVEAARELLNQPGVKGGE